MAEEAAGRIEQQADGAPKKRGPLLKIILIALVVLMLIGASVGGTLFATGFFTKSDHAKEAIDEQLDKLDDDAAPADGAAAKPGAEAPQKELVAPEADNQRWKFNYHSLEKPLLSNLSGSRKVMQVTLTVMTHYDDRVIKNVKTHELALRAGILDVMRQRTEADLKEPDFRKQLAEDIRLVVNSLLEKYEGFGGIEEVMFSEFVVQ